MREINNKMKIVLCTIPLNISNKRNEGQTPIPPKIAIVSLLRWMAKFGYSGDFYDIDMLLPSADEIFNYFKSKQPDIVGISAVVSGCYFQVKNLAQIIRTACPPAWIVVGGNMAACANVLLRRTEADICVLGEGEEPWVSLLDYVSRYETTKDVKELLKIKGIAFLNEEDEMEFTGYGEPIPDNENPFPDYELLSSGFGSQPNLVGNYFREGKSCNWFMHDARTYELSRKPGLAVLWTTKGCVGRCTFCQRFCKGYHTFDLKQLDSYLTELKERHNVQFIQINDEAFGANREYGLKVAEILKKHDMLWFCGGARCTSFTFEDLRFLHECGCTGIKFGVESGSQKILDIMEKRFMVDDVYAALGNAYRCGIKAPLALCIGMPGETDDTITETGQFLAKIARMRGIPPAELRPEVFWALPLPGAPLYEYGQLQGVIGTSVDEEEAFLINLFDKGAGKENYINLTGISTRRVLFWDFLLFYEVMRTYYSSPVKTQVADKSGDKPEVKIESVFTIKNALRFLPTPISLLNKLLFRRRLVTKIPRQLLYPIMRNLVYSEYLIRRFFTHLPGMFRKGQVKPQSKKRCDVITEAQSLRKINEKIKETRPVPQTLTEKNQQILRLGR